MIRQLVYKSHRHSGPDCGVLDQTDRRRRRGRTTVAADIVPKIKLNVNDQLSKVSKYVEDSHRAY
jgi:hypothetical protein